MRPKVLVVAGVAVNVKDERGRRPLRYTDKQGHTGAAANLRSNGAKKWSWTRDDHAREDRSGTRC